MKLFEVDLGSASDILRILQSNANKPGSAGTGRSLTVPFTAMINLLDRFDLGISTIDGIRKWVETVPGAKAVIDSVLDDGSVIVKTAAQNPNKDKAQQAGGASPAIDAMASKNAKTITK